MAGRGGVVNHKWDGLIPRECQSLEHILRFTVDHQWEQAHEPIHADIDKTKVCGVGPGMPFANSVQRSLGIVGLVPCAIGGTAIKEWARDGELYANMVKRASESAKDGGGEIKGLFWYQGESDSWNINDSLDYENMMRTVINNVRQDLALPFLPIILVVLASGDKFMEIVRQAQLALVNIPNVVGVDAKGLELNDDKLHLTTRAQVKLGQMLADAYMSHFVL